MLLKVCVVVESDSGTSILQCTCIFMDGSCSEYECNNKCFNITTTCIHIVSLLLLMFKIVSTFGLD